MAPSAVLSIGVLSDVICPWCWIGKRQLEAAQEQLSGRLRLDIRWLPFELNPGMPKEGVERRVYRRAKFGSLDYAARLDARVVEAGRAVGLDFRFERVLWTPNTFDAHRLIWLAGQQGVQSAMTERLFQAYFSEGRNIGDRTVLIELAGAAGLDPKKTGKLLASGMGAPEVREELERAQDIGIDSVPTILAGETPIASGAAPAETLTETFLRIGASA